MIPLIYFVSFSIAGATKEIGTALTRLCLRHKSIEAKLKALTGSIVETLVTPLQEHNEEWKKTVIQLDKDHARGSMVVKVCVLYGMAKLRHLYVSCCKGEMQAKLDNAMHDINDKYLVFEESEKNAVRRALIEERGHYCLFVSCLRPFVEHEISLITEITHLQEIMQNLCMQCSDPSVLPPASEQVIMDVKGFDSSSVWNFSQPSSLGSRKSSMCSISSINSSSSGSLKSHSPSHHNHKRNSAQQLPVGAARLTSVSSQDSGFTSQDTLFLRPATPSSLKIKKKEAPTYVNMSDLANMAKEKQASSDNDQTPTEKSPPYTMSTQQMRQNSVELAKAIQELEASTAALQSTYDGNTSQTSLHSSSGYGTMNSTPAGSEDTIATGDFDLSNQECMNDSEKYYTIPRNSEIGTMYKAVLQAKRPASTAGIPVSHTGGAPITRRSSMNTPKPPPPVRRSSSITTANPATIQKLRKTPPRQLQGNQSQPYAQPAPQNKHRRSSSSGGSEPAYAELQTIQQSIQARHQQQLNQQYQTEASPYATTATQNIPYSAPVTPQYAETNMMPPPSGGHVPPSSGHYTQQHQQQQQPAGQAELMQKLNAKFQALNAAYSDKNDHGLPPPPPNAGEIDHDLPPPPSQAELEEIEKIYSRPPPVNPKPTVNRTSNPENLRASLVSELKMGLRRVSSQDEGSEC
ncbi:hypothetical protein FSP39_014225 [Pinctada imbricata]|uniref:IMD domain-containing protein n=1 Tax=Pinctada imbricata TaxID=66713 RepID=A0AA89BM15_PINIB|nr:hypothetical protein FSP39_014225 [Pinctada imbricata]